MGIINSISQRVSQTYKNIDKKYFKGYLPGGYEYPPQVKNEIIGKQFVGPRPTPFSPNPFSPVPAPKPQPVPFTPVPKGYNPYAPMTPNPKTLPHPSSPPPAPPPISTPPPPVVVTPPPGNFVQKSTIISPSPTFSGIPLSFKPVVYTVPLPGEIIDEKTGKRIPVFDYRKSEALLTDQGDLIPISGAPQLATPKEIKENVKNVETGGTAPLPIVRKISSSYGKANDIVDEADAEIKSSLVDYGINQARVDAFADTLALTNPISYVSPQGSQLAKGISRGVVNLAYNEPVKLYAEYGLSAGFGAASEATVIGTRSAVEFLGEKLGSGFVIDQAARLGSAVRIGEIGLAGYSPTKAVITIIPEVLQKDLDTEKLGEIIGEVSTKGLIAQQGYKTGAEAVGEPIYTFREAPQRVTSVASTDVATLKKGDMQLNVAEFDLAGMKSIRLGEVTTKGEYYLRDFLGLEQKTRVIQIEPPVTVFTRTDPFIIEKGKIVGPFGDESIFGVKAKIYKATDFRQEVPIFSRLEGETIPEGRNINALKMEDLTPLDKALLKKLLTVNGPDFSYTVDLGKEAEVQSGNIIAKKLFKLKPNEAEFFPAGRTVSRGTILSTSKPEVLVSEGAVKDLFGFKGTTVESYSERIAVADTTFPGFRKGVEAEIPPRLSSIDLIEGKITRYEIELPEDRVPTNFQKFGKPIKSGDNLKLEFSDKQLLNQQVAGQSLIQKSIIAKTKPLPISKVNIGQATAFEKGASAFAGLGLYEKTSSTVFPNQQTQQSGGGLGNISIVSPSQFNRQFDYSLPKEIQIENTKNVTKDITKDVQKYFGRTIPREVPKEITKDLTTQVSKDVLKQISSQILKEVTKNPPPSEPVFVPFSYATPFSEPPSFGFKEQRRRKGKRVPAYSVLLKRKGKFSPVASGLTREKALRFGSEKTLRDLARTFKIAQSGTTETTDLESFYPSDKVFRGYKVKKGRRVETPDTFIQRTTANLQTPEEKAAIKYAKVSKLMGGRTR